MSFETTNLSVTLVNYIFTDEGPRGPWQVHSNDDQSMKKVLGAGVSGLCQYSELTNRFLSALSLPEAVLFAQSEFEGKMKTYLVLEIPKKEWEEKIEPVARSSERLAEIKSTADNVINAFKNSTR